MLFINKENTPTCAFCTKLQTSSLHFDTLPGGSENRECSCFNDRTSQFQHVVSTNSPGSFICSLYSIPADPGSAVNPASLGSLLPELWPLLRCATHRSGVSDKICDVMKVYRGERQRVFQTNKTQHSCLWQYLFIPSAELYIRLLVLLYTMLPRVIVCGERSRGLGTSHCRALKSQNTSQLTLTIVLASTSSVTDSTPFRETFSLLPSR